MNIPSVPYVMYSQPMVQIQPVLYGLQPNLYGIFGVNSNGNQYQAQQAQNESIKNSEEKAKCPPVSLLTVSGCRYHGQLYTVDISEQSIALKHVICYGTEGRKSGNYTIVASQNMYEYVIFNAINISQVWCDNTVVPQNMTKKYIEGVFFGWPRGVNGD